MNTNTSLPSMRKRACDNELSFKKTRHLNFIKKATYKVPNNTNVNDLPIEAATALPQQLVSMT